MSLAKTIARKGFGGLQSMAGSGDRESGIKLVGPQASVADIEEIKRRTAFYFAPEQAARVPVHAGAEHGPGAERGAHRAVRRRGGLGLCLMFPVHH